MRRPRGRGRWGRVSTQGRGTGQGRGRGISREEESGHHTSDVKQPQEERVNPPENAGSALKKKKGKRKSPTSLVVIELDDATAEYLLKESNFNVIQNLYEMTRKAKALLFLYTKSDVLEKLQTKFGESVETKVLDDKLTKNERKDEIMEIVVEYESDRITPAASVYVGALFTKKDMLHENRFRFGTVCSNLDELFALPDAPPASNEEENNNHLIHTLTSPTRQLNMEIESKKPEEGLDELKETVKFEDDPKNTPSSATRSLKSHSEFYISRLKDLSAKISSKLAHKFEEIKPKMLTFDLKNTQIPNLQSSENHLLSKEERQRLEHRDRDLEEIIFAQLKKGSISKDQKPFSVSELCTNEMAAKIKDIRFEVQDEMDSQPILRKLKVAAEVKKDS